MQGSTDYYKNAYNFRVKDANIVHHGCKGGTRENVSYYSGANRFSFDNLNITHLANSTGAAQAPSPRAPSADGSRRHSHWGTRPATSVGVDRQNTFQRWSNDYPSHPSNDIHYTHYGPNLSPGLQGQYPGSASSINVVNPQRPAPPRGPFHTSFGPNPTFLPAETFRKGTSSVDQRRDRQTQRRQQRGSGERQGNAFENEHAWQMSDDSESDDEDSWSMSDDSEEEDPHGRNIRR